MIGGNAPLKSRGSVGVKFVAPPIPPCWTWAGLSARPFFADNFGQPTFSKARSALSSGYGLWRRCQSRSPAHGTGPAPAAGSGLFPHGGPHRSSVLNDADGSSRCVFEMRIRRLGHRASRGPRCRLSIRRTMRNNLPSWQDCRCASFAPKRHCPGDGGGGRRQSGRTWAQCAPIAEQG